MSPPKKRSRSPSSTPVPSTEEAGTAPSPSSPNTSTAASTITEAQWEAMHAILSHIYNYRTDDGFDPSKLFHRKVNRRVIPEYYETIAEPMALSTIKQKLHSRAYTRFADFVRDFALIPHNAQVFNRADSGAFQDALVVKEQLETQLLNLAEKGVITKDVAELPYLGEIPTYEEAPLEEAEGEEGEEEDSDEEADEEEEEEEPDLDDEGRPMVKKRRGRPPGSKTRRDKDADEGENKRARGRPPKLLTPMEARILAVLKGLRKPKNNRGQLIIKHFDRLPDKASMPEYYAEIKQPIAYDILKRKVKRKKYPTLEAFMSDVNLMLNNAKEYNTDDSQIFQDAVQLQVDAGRLYDAEKAKPDDSFADDEGKIPMPNGILHNGELYRVGDWIHVQNPNDLTKPIPAQIYRTYKNPAGQSMVNVCWYYRPEQTVHRFDKHFLTNEVLKTGRYRDHPIDQVEGKCFIMFYTRYFKGRPRGLPEGTEIYVCKDRYNEDRHQFNTIKTWASCLPDEVRDRDYEMDLFEHAHKMKKHPSPIAYLLKDEQKETDELPKVQWGAEGAPPKIGAVHRRPRNEKDSPPPEPTPPPPPAPTPKVERPAAAARPLAQVAPSYQGVQQQQQQNGARPPSAGGVRPPTYPPGTQAPSYASGGGSTAVSGSGAGTPLPQRPPSASSSSNAQAQPHSSFAAPATPQTQPAARPAAPAPSSSFQQHQQMLLQNQQQAQQAYTPLHHHQQQQQQQPATLAPNNSNSSTHAPLQMSQSHQQHHPQQSHYPPPLGAAPRPPGGPAGSYRDPPAIEVYTLPDQANLSIPAEVRERFQRDEAGRVLWFVTPPVATTNTVSSSSSSAAAAGGVRDGAKGRVGGHSVRFLAARARRAEMRKANGEVGEAERAAKKARTTLPTTTAASDIDAEKGSRAKDQASLHALAALKERARLLLERQLAEGVLDSDSDSPARTTDSTRTVGRGVGLGDEDLRNLSAAQKAMSEQMRAVEANRGKRREVRRVGLGRGGEGMFGSGFADDWDGRVG